MELRSIYREKIRKIKVIGFVNFSFMDDDNRQFVGETMRIGVIQASSQISKNQIIYDAVYKYAPKEAEVINYGCTMEEKEKYSFKLY